MESSERERGTFYATLRVELEDVTEAVAREFWGALVDYPIDLGGYIATVVAVTPEVVP